MATKKSENRNEYNTRKRKVKVEMRKAVTGKARGVYRIGPNRKCSREESGGSTRQRGCKSLKIFKKQ